ncbi:ParB N-terminal domain-containing protein [Aliivibrio fischeri]|uniref:ParB N-terminal domain-containing protein n=1 Tax=Aliivibrio fischeri TaxID=668 RepID=UPI0007C4FBED|nr:ParB N-terminal domain-containing protein [Aliivibrio fischeri]MUK37539.1 chromosome partitioning protein ParB [Aliivibrio fischeri]
MVKRIGEKDKVSSFSQKSQVPSSVGQAHSRELNLDELSKQFQNEELEELEPITLDKELAKVVSENSTGLTITYHGEETHFNYIEIESQDIEVRTQVAPENGRIQEWLTPYSLNKLADSIRSRGMIKPALGYLDNGIIYVIDGSSRRKACIFADKPFRILVSERRFDSSFISELSSEANEHREPSLYERGLLWSEQINKGESQAQFAKRIKVNAALVSTGLKACQINRDIIDLFPSPPDIGRTTLTKLDKLLPQVKEEAILIDLLREMTGELVFNSEDPLQRNSLFLDSLTKIVDDIKDTKPKEDKFKVNSHFGNGDRKGSFTVSKSGALNAKITRPSKKDIEELIKLLEKEYLS